MAFGAKGEASASLKGTLTRTGDFRGRARRTEVVYWWIATTLSGLAAMLALSAILTIEASTIALLILTWVLAITSFALFTRRLHDQNRSGKLAVLLPMLLALATGKAVVLLNAPTDAVLSGRVTMFEVLRWATNLVGLVVLILFLLPGSDGRNRFGDDPRL